MLPGTVYPRPVEIPAVAWACSEERPSVQKNGRPLFVRVSFALSPKRAMRSMQVDRHRWCDDAGVHLHCHFAPFPMLAAVREQTDNAGNSESHRSLMQRRLLTTQIPFPNSGTPPQTASRQIIQYHPTASPAVHILRLCPTWDERTAELGCDHHDRQF
jgi:hypothetical protein